MARCSKCRQTLPYGFPRNAGEPWTRADDEWLRLHAHSLRNKGVSADAAIPILARVFHRTDGGIRARLEKLDLITP